MNPLTRPGEPRHCAANLVTPSSAHPVLDAETQQFLDVIAEAGLHPDDLLLNDPPTIDGSEQTATPADGLAVVTDDLTLAVGPTGSVAVRIVRPAGVSVPLPVVMYFHGGGWRMGDRITHGRLIRKLAVQAEVAVVFVDYTLTPHARYPVQNEQAYAALTYVVEHAEALGVEPSAIAVAGDGAGGNMAAAVTLLAKQRHGPRIALQVLLCPILSAGAHSRSYAQYADGPGLTASAVQASIHAQFPAGCVADKLAMPLNATTDDLEGLPSALIVTAENDVVRDDAEAYARKLMRAGVEVSATRYLGTIHDFVVFDGLAHTFPTTAALAQACAALKAALRKSGRPRSQCGARNA
ncbi:alpha/beta hydrolase [Paraburkholderia bryophila]|uniref:Acetyl esterase n=1 Tax=Paraburkholderia bryophila TaxID=420952 RepID=A0A329BX84_9BURK|nr:alpha/beta hydrolase [Paraburkholderia bryophila]RAS26447.1 acetyl esterase [Paraburkholderia bryophila]